MVAAYAPCSGCGSKYERVSLQFEDGSSYCGRCARQLQPCRKCGLPRGTSKRPICERCWLVDKPQADTPLAIDFAALERGLARGPGGAKNYFLHLLTGDVVQTSSTTPAPESRDYVAIPAMGAEVHNEWRRAFIEAHVPDRARQVALWTALATDLFKQHLTPEERQLWVAFRNRRLTALARTWLDKVGVRAIKRERRA